MPDKEEQKEKKELKALINKAKKSEYNFGFAPGKDKKTHCLLLHKTKKIKLPDLKEAAQKKAGKPATKACIGVCGPHPDGGMFFQVDKGKAAPPAAMKKQLIQAGQFVQLTLKIDEVRMGPEAETEDLSPEEMAELALVDDTAPETDTTEPTPPTGTTPPTDPTEPTPPPPPTDPTPPTSPTSDPAQKKKFADVATATKDLSQVVTQTEKSVQELQKAILKTGHPNAQGIAKGYMGFIKDGPLGDMQKVARDIVGSSSKPDDVANLTNAFKTIYTECINQLKMPIVTDIETNPFVKVEIRKALAPALDRLNKAVGSLSK